MECSIQILKKEQLNKFKWYLTADALEQFENPEVHAAGALDGDKLVGVVCFRIGEVPAILSVGVSPEYQEEGIGSQLVDYVAGAFIENNIPYMQAVLFDDHGSADDIEYFLYRCGFDLAEEHPDIEIALKDAVKTKEFSELIKKQAKYEDIHFLHKLSDKKKNQLGNLLKNNSSYKEFPEKGLIEEISVCCMLDDMPVACVLVGEDGDRLTIQYVFVSPECKNKMALLHMLTYSLGTAVNKYGLNKMIHIISTGDVSDKMLYHLFENKASGRTVKRYILNFAKGKETSIDDAVSEIADEAGDETDEPKSKFEVDPVFEQLTNADLVCRDCIYRSPGSPVMLCHKYSMKPDEVINGETCSCYRKGLEV